MDCQVFDVLLDDLARDLPMEASIRQRGLHHMQECALCRARLAEARSLARALQAIAAADALEQAPLITEGILLNAFEEHMKGDRPLRVARVLGRRSTLIAAAAAAIVLGLAMGLVLRKTPGGLTFRQRTLTQTSAISSPHQPAAASQSRKDSKPRGRQAESTRAGVRTRNQLNQKMQRPRTRVVWATDFLPLPYADNATPLGDARIVRLKLPNSALASMGLPIIEEDSTTKEVTADVLLGEDGIPRAIRLVRL